MKLRSTFPASAIGVMASAAFCTHSALAAISVVNGNFSDGLNGWTLTGTPSAATGAAVITNGQGILQDFAPGALDGLTSFQADFSFSISSFNNTTRIRLEGNNGTDMISMRINASTTAGASSIDTVNSSNAFVAAVSGLTLTAATNYFIRVTGTGFGTADRSYVVGFSTDGVNYSSSTAATRFHSGSATANLFETLTFEGGATAGTQLTIDNVTVSGTSIPEPAAAMLGAVGSLALLRRRTR